ncbi:MAG: type II secretion system F family protein [Syntrophobacterales bacterium]|nr:type II secretion system F family protein [Syntrophobacterales bacterium]
MLIAILFGLSIAAVIISVGHFLQGRGSRVRRRLQVGEGKKEAKVKEERVPEFLPKELVDKAEEKLGFKRGSAQVKEVKKTLQRAGIHGERALSIFLGLKLGLSVALPVMVLPVLHRAGVVKGLLLPLFFLFAGVGYFLPNLILNRLVEARQKKIRESLPDALDLLVVCVEAGQGLNAALKRVADDLKISSPALSQELTLVNLEIAAGLEREQALRNLAERTGVEEVASLCSMLIQSDRFGTSMAQALKVQSDTLRTTRRQKLEELAAKTPVKLVFPLLLFIFPALMVVIIGPAAIRIMENLK